MCQKYFKHYLIISLYGVVLLVLFVGTENLFGSRVDWLSQHTVFPDVFRQNFYESGRIIPEFLFDIGGGQNIFHFIYYGFLSPCILLSYLLPFVDMTTYIINMSIILYLASGCLLYQFLKAHFAQNIALWAGIIFLTLSPMTYHFHRHIMFVWYIPFFILGLIGIDRYFEKKKSGLFIISTVCLILTNYMFSVGCLVFLFVYAVFRILQKESFLWKDSWKNICGIIVLFIIPVLMSAFVLLPTGYTLFSNERSGGSEIELSSLLFPSFEEYFYGSYNMGISAIMLVAIIGNLMCKEKKKADIFLNIFSLLILICPIILFILNGTLYIRGKAIIACSVLFLYNLCLFTERLARNEIKIKSTVTLSILFVVIFTILNTSNWKIGLLLLLELFVIGYLLKKKNRLYYIWPIMVSFIASFAANNFTETFVTKEYYEKMFHEEILELMEETEEGFYRTNIAYREMDTANRVYGENFHGNSLYSSTYNSYYQRFYESYMGNNEKYRNEFMTTGAVNELFYHFMGTKYIIGTKDPGFSYELVEKGEHLNLYKNENANPVVYKSKKIMTESQFDELEFPFSTEALMTHTIIGDGDKSIYETKLNKCDVIDKTAFVQNSNKSYTIKLDESYKDKVIYLGFDIKNEGEYLNKQDIRITINGITNKLTDSEWLYHNGNTRFDYVIPMENKTTLTIQISKGKYNISNLKMYTSNQLLTEYEEAENLSFDESASKITCNVDAQKGEYLVTSIPYDAGFSAYINGEKAKVEIVNKAFVGIELQEGKNDIVIKYNAPLFKEGIWISCFGMFMWIMKVIWDTRRCTNENISNNTLL